MERQRDLEFVLEALYTFEAELDELEHAEEWFVSDSRDRLESAKEILKDILGITDYDYDEDSEGIEQGTLELHFD